VHKLLIWALLAIVPFTSLRMVCTDPAGGVSADTVQFQESPDCQEICARIKPPQSGSNCALVSETSLLSLVAVEGVVPVQGLPRVRSVAVLFETEFRDFYLPPVLDRQSPPPKT